MSSTSNTVTAGIRNRQQQQLLTLTKHINQMPHQISRIWLSHHLDDYTASSWYRLQNGTFGPGTRPARLCIFLCECIHITACG